MLVCYRRFAEAIPYLTQVVEFQTTFLGHWLLGVAYRGVGQLDEAVASGEAAVELSSRHPWSLVEFALSLLRARL